MQQATGDLFALADTHNAWTVITTNGAVQNNGRLIMGAGVAATAARHHPHLPAALGALVTQHGNVPVADDQSRTMTWPTKPAVHDLDGRTHAGWMCAARVRDPRCVRGVARLVWANAPRVVALADVLGLDGPIYLPAPGCGLGGLKWDDVRPHLAGVLDDRFVVVTLPEARPTAR